MTLARRRFLLAVLVLAAAAALAWALRPRPVEVEVVAVALRPLEITLDEEGETRVRERYEVSSPVAGRVLRLELEPGDPVVSGETVLATLLAADPLPLDPRRRAEGEARVRAARAVTAQAAARLAQADEAAGLAERDLGRRRALVAAGVEAARELDAAEAAAATARDAGEAARHARAAARHELAAAEAALLEAGSGGVAGTFVLRSPADGVVLERRRESEAVVAAGEPLVVVGDPGDLEIVADFLSADAVRIAPGQRVVVEEWGSAAPLAGRVRRIEPFAFTKVSALGVEEQRVNVRIDLAAAAGDERRRLGDGYRVTVRVVVWEGERVPTVPTSSLFRRGGGWELFVVEGGEARRRAVEVGWRNDALAEVVSGVDLDERVIAYPGERVADGTRVVARQGD